MKGPFKLFPLVAALAIAGCNTGGSSSIQRRVARRKTGSPASRTLCPSGKPSMKPGAAANLWPAGRNATY